MSCFFAVSRSCARFIQDEDPLIILLCKCFMQPTCMCRPTCASQASFWPPSTLNRKCGCAKVCAGTPELDKAARDFRRPRIQVGFPPKKFSMLVQSDDVRQRSRRSTNSQGSYCRFVLLRGSRFQSETVRKPASTYRLELF